MIQGLQLDILILHPLSIHVRGVRVPPLRPISHRFVRWMTANLRRVRSESFHRARTTRRETTRGVQVQGCLCSMNMARCPGGALRTVDAQLFPLQTRGRWVGRGRDDEKPHVVPKDARTGVSDGRGVSFTVVQQRDRHRHACVRLCGGSEGNETVNRSGSWAAVFRIWRGVDGRPGF